MVSKIPLRYDDGFRAAITMLISLPILVWPFIQRIQHGAVDPMRLITAGCITLGVAFLLYIWWTHRLFSRTPADLLQEIAATLHRQGASRLAKIFGVASTESWAISAALTALIGSLAAAVYGGRSTGIVLTLIVMFTAVTAWMTVVYAYALKYLRVHSAGEAFSFTHDEPLRFEDFLMMSAMISSAGSNTAATATTRESLRVVRTHTIIAFGFNALVIAMAVSLISGLVQSN